MRFLIGRESFCLSVQFFKNIAMNIERELCSRSSILNIFEKLSAIV